MRTAFFSFLTPPARRRRRDSVHLKQTEGLCAVHTLSVLHPPKEEEVEEEEETTRATH